MNEPSAPSADIDCQRPDFTLAAYQAILTEAVAQYDFASYGTPIGACPSAIWRHDIDCSPHRALDLARLEFELSARCIYHVLLTGPHYNPLEPETRGLLQRIIRLNHEVGLHFDMDVFGESKFPSIDAIESRIDFERKILEELLEAPVSTVSFHNFALNRERITAQPELAGLINAGATTVVAGRKYVSDSNGIWQFDELRNVVDATTFPHIHVLTHPVWWTVHAMTPTERFDSMIDERSKRIRQGYTDIMARDGRLEHISSRLGLEDRARSVTTADKTEPQR